MKTPLSMSLLCASLVLSSNAFAAETCAPVLKDGWIRQPPLADAMMVAGFGTLENPCKDNAVVVSAQSPAFAGVSLHQSMVMDGMAMMHELQALPVAAGKSVTLAPGGTHLMLMRTPHAPPLNEGDLVPITFKLKDGREIAARLQVKKTAP